MAVLLGTSVAYYQEGTFNILLFALVMVALVSVQFAENLEKTYFLLRDERYDNPLETHFMFRAHDMRLGGVNSNTVLFFAFISAALSGVIGLYLEIVTPGHVVSLLVFAGLMLAFFYAAPPLKLAYRGLAEIVCFFSYGPFTVFGAYYVQTRSLSIMPVAISISLGFLTCAISYIRYFTHYDAYKKIFVRNPISTYNSRERAFRGYLLLLLLAYVSAISVTLLDLAPIGALLILGSAPFAYLSLKQLKDYLNEPEKLGIAINSIIAAHFFGGILLSLGFFVS
jgi:1,4-dihydroxy-2-naphthoate octaprenyltransferase